MIGEIGCIKSGENVIQDTLSILLLMKLAKHLNQNKMCKQ